MGIWDEPAGAFPAALAQDGPLARALASLYGNRIIPIPRGTAEEAGSALYGMTGIPDIQSGAQAMGRGEYLPGFGQMAFGFGSLGALGAPWARGAATVGREALGALPGVLADTTGAIRLPFVDTGALARTVTPPEIRQQVVGDAALEPIVRAMGRPTGPVRPEGQGDFGVAEKIARADRLREENMAPLGGDTFFQRLLAERQAAQAAPSPSDISLMDFIREYGLAGLMAGGTAAIPGMGER